MGNNDILLTKLSVTFIILHNNHISISYHMMIEYVSGYVINLTRILGKYNKYGLLTNSNVTQHHFHLMNELLV